MSYFLSSQNLSVGQQTELSGEEARHILLARRKKAGERFNLQDPAGKRFEVELIEANKNHLAIKVVAEVPVPAEPKIKIILFQSFVNEKALDFILQKSTELEAYGIVLFNSFHTATKLSQDQFTKKKNRWTKILWESAKQSDRARPPLLEFTNNVDEKITELEKVLLCDPAGNNWKLEVGGWKFNPNGIGIVIGPEGGFTPQEVEHFKSIPNITLLSLGPILLRAETAALSALAVVSNLV